MGISHKETWHETKIDFNDEEDEMVTITLEPSDTIYNVIFKMEVGNSLILLELTDYQLSLMADGLKYVLDNKDNHLTIVNEEA